VSDIFRHSDIDPDITTQHRVRTRSSITTSGLGDDIQNLCVDRTKRSGFTEYHTRVPGRANDIRTLHSCVARGTCAATYSDTRDEQADHDDEPCHLYALSANVKPERTLLRLRTQLTSIRP